MKILGIDFGQKKIGLAISEGFLAEPLGIIERSKIEKQILNICHEYAVAKIVVGLSEGRTAEKQRRFAQEIARITHLPVDFQDETLTSKEAVAKMKEIGKRLQDEDAISAALILQNYLDKGKSV